MIPIKQLKKLTREELDRLLYRFGEDFSGIMTNTVIPIVNEVRDSGDFAVRTYTKKFDGVSLDSILASPKEIEEGHKRTPKDVFQAFLSAKENIKEFHQHQVRDDIQYTREDGTIMGVTYHPIDSAAVYVPGGKATYPSSVLMGIIPAQIAGTENITLVTPPDEKGAVPDIICSICIMLGISTVVKSGGAQGIAAVGFGTESVPKADIIVGPGNIYVTAAKAYLFSLGIIQIDSMAGPSEVVIIADKSVNPKWVAWDLLSQAEHDEMAIAILITDSEELAAQVAREIEKDISLKAGRHTIKKASIRNNGLILLVDAIDEAIEFSNRYGPEHLQIMTQEPMDYLSHIRNVGSLFLGTHAPVAIGDYFSGTNHILPTGGAARFSSGTSVDTFTRRTTFQLVTPEGLERARQAVDTMARIEGFSDKHGGSVNIRFEEKK